MSGSSATFPFPTSLGTRPPEGSKYAQQSINWPSVYTSSGTFATTINLLSQFQSGRFTTVQAVYVDNSTCLYPVSLVCAETQQKVTVGPFTQAMLPLITSPAAQYAVTLNAVPYDGGGYLALGSTNLIFLNVAQDSWANQALAGTTNFQSVNGAATMLSAPVQLLPGLAANQHYAISAINLAMYTSYSWSTALPVQVTIRDGNNVSNFIFLDGFLAVTSTPNFFYGKQFIYPQPILQATAGNPLNLALSAYPAGVSNVIAYWQITYGVVTIS